MKRHSMDMVSLVFGVIFASIIGWWALARSFDFGIDGKWIGVAALLAAGLLTLISALRGRKPQEPVATNPIAAEDTRVADDDPVTDFDAEERAEDPTADEPVHDNLTLEYEAIRRRGDLGADDHEHDPGPGTERGIRP